MMKSDTARQQSEGEETCGQRIIAVDTHSLPHTRDPSRADKRHLPKCEPAMYRVQTRFI